MAARPLLIGVAAIVAVAVGLGLVRGCHDPTAVATERATVYPEPRPVPELALVGQDGRRIDPEFFRRGWTLVFFGFTRCPDVCPTTLATLARARSALADLPATQRPRVLLVSVDPERDDPARLAAYVRFFDPTFLAATGDPAAIAAAAAAFGVPYAKVAQGPADYTIDHGAGVFVVAPDGIVAYSGAPHDAAVLARDFRRLQAGHESQG